MLASNQFYLGQVFRPNNDMQDLHDVLQVNQHEQGNRVKQLPRLLVQEATNSLHYHLLEQMLLS